MYDVLVRFASELRRTGVPVSPTEVVDAAQALEVSDLDDVEHLRVALAATLIKKADHLAAFDVAFEVYFGRKRDPGGEGGGPNDTLDTLPDAELGSILTDAVVQDDRLTMTRLAEIMVTRHARMEAGRAVAGRAYLFRVLRVVEIDTLGERAVGRAGAGGGTALGGLGSRLQRERIESGVGYFTTEVESEIRRRLVADRGDDAVAAVVRQTVPEAIGLLNANSSDLVVLRRAIAPLARKLAARLARRRRIARRGELDFRGTFRQSLSTGGVPVTLRFKPPAKPKPELVVIADVSGSVAAFSRFTFQLLYAMRSEFRKMRSFAFIDNLIEVSDVLDRSTTAEQVWHTILGDKRLIWLDGRSDYGHALQTFTGAFGSAVSPRSTVLILGDARNNYRGAQEQELEAISKRAHRVYWLNPETRRDWDSGDSVVRLYRRFCTDVVECQNLSQLQAFTDRLL